ncbi:hypothetical protein H0H87_003043 [Tephrocybe sp. NHM501043]|nr:hypothetical protein H0H87_003043 [Tephrocybe sp. NHM501043]
MYSDYFARSPLSSDSENDEIFYPPNSESSFIYTFPDTNRPTRLESPESRVVSSNHQPLVPSPPPDTDHPAPDGKLSSVFPSPPLVDVFSASERRDLLGFLEDFGPELVTEGTLPPSQTRLQEAGPSQAPLTQAPRGLAQLIPRGQPPVLPQNGDRPRATQPFQSSKPPFLPASLPRTPHNFSNTPELDSWSRFIESVQLPTFGSTAPSRMSTQPYQSPQSSLGLPGNDDSPAKAIYHAFSSPHPPSSIRPLFQNFPSAPMGMFAKNSHWPVTSSHELDRSVQRGSRAKLSGEHFPTNRPSPYPSKYQNLRGHGVVRRTRDTILSADSVAMPLNSYGQSSSVKLKDGAANVPLDRRALASVRTHRILDNEAHCRALLHARGSDAQVLLNFFQWLLDDPTLLEDFRRRLIVATQRLSTKSGLYPTCYDLKGVTQDSVEPVTGGGFADIYKGSFRGQAVCLKTIRIYQDSQLQHVLKQFSKEVILWGQLSHTNVLPIYGLFHFKNRLCIVSPWMQNGDIVTFLRLNPKVDRLALAFDVAKGLSYLHNNSIIHGDLKGPNILIDEQGRARLCDFGIASICDPEIKAWTTQSSVSSKGGSTRWQAPELFDLNSDEDVPNTVFSDVYAFGCVCYEVFTGNIPFHNIFRDATVTLQVQSGKRPLRPEDSSVSWLEWGLTESIWLLMEDCWNAAVNERPSVEQVIGRLLPLLRKDERTRGSGNVLPPPHFRRSISEPPDDMTIASFERLCGSLLGKGLSPAGSL